jgi:hypothetical protein
MMARVQRHDNMKRAAIIPDDLLEDFFGECLGITVETPVSVAEFLDNLKKSHRHMLDQYIIHRLAEVDPGYIPKPYDPK